MMYVFGHAKMLYMCSKQQKIDMLKLQYTDVCCWQVLWGIGTLPSLQFCVGTHVLILGEFWLCC